jgi:4-hydroxybenzoate polyprenyltransferase
MRRFLFLLRVSRPIVWILLPIVYFLGLHAAHGNLSTVAIVQMLLLTFPMNIVGCGLNDIYDYESDRLCTRRAKIWGAVVDGHTRPMVWRAAVVMAPLVIAGSLLTLNAWNVAATVGLLVIAWVYSVPPIRLKERPPLDSLANGLGYFLLPFVMGYSLEADPSQMPAKFYLLALCVAGIHSLAAAADYDVDQAAGHRTIAVVYGKRPAAGFAAVAFVIAWFFGGFSNDAVRIYLVLCATGAIIAAVAPRQSVISATCTLNFVLFPFAAAGYLFGN